ncbi:hypothetical protein M011DRAFT_481808 [Sporormia fimetaria CBS 119925]|uniref:Uncharacterized protein n=1 Tax=Sporormia fimetaria CBS 119925 TaxID=1340428 RepID=A0A6A6UZD0_9PLEO|nr:hypothetical protein M011DRAFT_481808 [Sporormia fimetaria CBS 119925]
MASSTTAPAPMTSPSHLTNIYDPLQSGDDQYHVEDGEGGVTSFEGASFTTDHVESEAEPTFTTLEQSILHSVENQVDYETNDQHPSSISPTPAQAPPPKPQTIVTRTGLTLRASGFQNYRWSLERFLIFVNVDCEIPQYIFESDTPTHPVWSRTVATANTSFAGLEDVEFTAVEILTFMPALYQVHGVIHRLISNGWLPSEIAHLINETWGTDEDAGVRADTVKHQGRASDKKIYGAPWLEYAENAGISPVCPRVTDFTPRHWYAHGGSFQSWEKGHATDPCLVDLAVGISPAKFPQGEDAKLLTEGIMFAEAHGLCIVKLSELRTLLKHKDWKAQVTPMAADADHTALNRSRARYRAAHPGRRCRKPTDA